MENVVIFSASLLAREIYQFISSYAKKININYFLDNNMELTEYLGIPVYHPDEVNLKKFPILVASKYYKEIKAQLVSKGLVENVDFFNITIFQICKEELEKCSSVLEKFNEGGVKYHFIQKDELQRYKKTDKLFVFGTGSTINDYTIEQWQDIQQYDSWGLNFFNVHWFVPTYYSMEFFYLDREKFSMITNNVKLRGEYPLVFVKDIPNGDIYVKYVKEEFESIPITLDVRIHTFDEFEYEGMMRLIQKIKLQEAFSEQGIHLGGVTSVTTVIMHALSLGYKEIILCGVDLSTDFHFFEQADNGIFDGAPMQYPVRLESEIKKEHPTISGSHAIRADKAINIINDTLLKSKGITLKVFSEKSLLAKSLGVYKME